MPGFAYPVATVLPTEIYVPPGFQGADYVPANTRNFTWTAIGRLRDGVSVTQATAEMSGLNAALDAQHPGWSNFVIGELPKWERPARDIRRADRARPTAPPPPPPHGLGNPLAALSRRRLRARTLRKSPTYTAVALTVLAAEVHTGIRWSTGPSPRALFQSAALTVCSPRSSPLSERRTGLRSLEIGQ